MEPADYTLNFILVAALRQPFHHSSAAVVSEAIPAGQAGLICLSRSDLSVGVWKDTSCSHDRIRPDLAGNSEFLAEIAES